MADKKPTAPAQDVTKDWQASQSQKSSAGNFRLFAAIAWIIAIAGECYGVWLIYHRAFDQGGQPLLLGLLIGIAVFAIAGNLFWKAANRPVPPTPRASSSRISSARSSASSPSCHSSS